MRSKHGTQPYYRQAGGEDGADRRTARSRSWQHDTERHRERHQRFEAALRDALRAHTWLKATSMCTDALPLLFLRLKISPQPWIQRLWPRSCRQYSSSCPHIMARKAQKMMNEDDSSCIYDLVSFSSAIPYIGRAARSDQLLMATIHSKRKYKAMSSAAKAREWHFVPLILCKGHMPLSQLKDLEGEKIDYHPKSWDRMQSSSVRLLICLAARLAT